MSAMDIASLTGIDPTLASEFPIVRQLNISSDSLRCLYG